MPPPSRAVQWPAGSGDGGGREEQGVDQLHQLVRVDEWNEDETGPHPQPLCLGWVCSAPRSPDQGQSQGLVAARVKAVSNSAGGR